MSFRPLPLLALLAACATDPSASGDTSGVTGNDSANTDSNDTGDGGDCDVRLTSTDPAEGAMGVYIHAPITLNFSGDASGADIEVRDPAGTAAPTSEAWAEGNLHVVLTADLAPSTTYTIHAELCGVTQEAHFTTSSIGGMDFAPGDLVGRTYTFALKDAEITEPAILEAFDDAKLTSPLGFMVENADDASIDFLGALLTIQGGDYVQVTDAPTWDFPASDFSKAPYFAIAIDDLTFVYSDPINGIPDTDIMLHEFEFDGTFSADGASILMGHIDTLVDTRTLGPLFGLADTDNAVCDFATGFAVDCVTCPDGEAYCLHTIGEDITAPEVEGLTLKAYP